MTDRKHLKSRVRARMARTGERYATARTHVVAAAGGPTAASPSAEAAPTTTVPAGTGVNPAASALRHLLADVGVDVPESLALVIGGGIGMGVFQFHYANEGVGTFFLAGRHAWDDDRAFLVEALGRLGIHSVVTETTSARVAERQLRDTLATGRTVVAWVDLAELGTRAYPPEYRGGAYHVVVVRSIDDERGTAMLDDLAAVPVEVPLDVLARARSRIRSQRSRLLTIAPGTAAPDAATINRAIRDGLAATVRGLDHPRSRSFGLDALADWSVRLRGTGRDSWAVVFPPGARLWSGLAAIHENVEHWGSGGGLVRPTFAAGLQLSAQRLGDDRLGELARRYEDLGAKWTELAAAALPDGVPAFRRTRRLQDDRAARYASAGGGAQGELAAAWDELAAVRAEVDDCFPLEGAAPRALLDHLADRVDTLRGAESEALAILRAWSA